jgi:hypothetical protein
VNPKGRGYNGGDERVGQRHLIGIGANHSISLPNVNTKSPFILLSILKRSSSLRSLSFTLFLLFFSLRSQSKHFLEYDAIVEKRQAHVLRKAVAAEAIVNSLFPHNVRDRVFQNAKQPQASTKKGSRSVDQSNSKNQRLKRIMLAGIAPKARNRKAGQPIADLFSDTTVVRVRYSDYGSS